MQPLSTYSSLLTQNNIMINTSLLTTKLGNELSTGKKAVDLADNPDRLAILDLTQTKNDKEAYVKSCTLGQITTAQYTNSLSHIESIATTALKQIQSLIGATQGQVSSSTTGIPGDQDRLNLFTNLSQTITQSLNDLTISLNERTSTGNGYLYAGLRSPSGELNYTLPPVRDLNSLPYFAAPSGAVLTPEHPSPTPSAAYAAAPVPSADPTGVDAMSTPPQFSNPVATPVPLPSYDSDYGKTDPAAPLPTLAQMAWGVQKLTIDTTETVNASINSTDPVFQNLVNGLRAAKTAADQSDYDTVGKTVGGVAVPPPTGFTVADRDHYMSVAYSCLTAALNGARVSSTDQSTGAATTVWSGGIRGLEQQNSLSDLSIQTKSNLHTKDLDAINTRLDSLVGVDATTVTVQLATANNQLQAAYKVTASLLSMSLINYLK